MQKKTYVTRVLCYQGIGFLLIITSLCIFDIFFSAATLFDWRECLLKNVFVLAVAIPQMALTGKLVSRLYRLEGFLTLCAWCKNMQNDKEWILPEEYFKKQFDVESSHGICPQCYKQTQQKIKNSDPM